MASVGTLEGESAEIGVRSETPKPFQEVGIGEKYVPEHGRGELLRGNPGNSGRPSREVKELWSSLAQQQAFEYALRCLEDPEASATEKIAAMRTACEYGIDKTSKVEIVDLQKVLATLAKGCIQLKVDPQVAENLVSFMADDLGIK